MPIRPDPLHEDLDRVQSDVADLRAELERQKAEAEQFRAKFGPGTKFLVDLEERLVYSGTITAVKNTVTTTLVDTLQGALHASYRVSTQPTETGVGIIGDGAGTIPTNGIAVALGREYKTSPIRIEVSVRLTNTHTTTDHPIAVKVWRRMGLA